MKEFKRIYARFDAVDARFDAMDSRFDRVEQRLVHVEELAEDTAGRLISIDDRLSGVEYGVLELKRTYETTILPFISLQKR